MKRPLFVIGLTYLFATMVAVYFGKTFVISISLFCIFIGTVTYFVKDKRYNIISIICLTCVVASMSFLLHNYFGYNEIIKMAGKDVTVTGVVYDVSENVGSTSIKVHGKINDGIETKKANVVLYSWIGYEAEVGNTIKAKTHVNGTYDSTFLYYSEGIYLSGLIDEIEILKKVTSKSFFTSMQNSYIKEVKNKVREEVSPLAIAVASGNTDSLTFEQKDVLNSSGISHITAVSGLHMMIIYGYLGLILKKFGICKKVQALILVPAILGFMAFSGYSYSVLRSGIMIMIYMLGKCFYRQTDSLTSLAFAGIIIVAINPNASVDIGFLLSFFAVLGIIVCSNRIYKLLGGTDEYLTKSSPFIKRFHRYVARMLGVGVGAYVFTLPILLFTFGSVSIFSPVTTMLVSWTIPIIFVLIPIILVGGNIPNLYVLYKISEIVLTVIIKGIFSVARFVSSLEFSVICVSEDYIFVWLIGVYIIFGYIYAKKKPLKIKIYSVIFAVCSLIIGTISYNCLNYNCYKIVNFKDCFVMNYGDTAVLVGNVRNHYEALLIEKYMKNNHITNIDVAILDKHDTNRSLGYVYLMEKGMIDKFICTTYGQLTKRINMLMGKENIYNINTSVVKVFNNIMIKSSRNNIGYDIYFDIGNKKLLKTSENYDIIIKQSKKYTIVFSYDITPIVSVRNKSIVSHNSLSGDEVIFIRR